MVRDYAKYELDIIALLIICEPRNMNAAGDI